MCANANPLAQMAPHFQTHIHMVYEIAKLSVNFLFEDYSIKKIREYQDMSKAFVNEIGLKIGKMSQTAQEIYTVNLTLYQQAFDDFISSLKNLSPGSVDLNNIVATYNSMRLLYQILAIDENSDNITAAQLLVDLTIGIMQVFSRKYTAEFKKMNQDFLDYIPKNTSKILKKVFTDFSRIKKFVKDHPGRNSISDIEKLVKLWQNAIPYVSIYRCSALVAQMPKAKQASVKGTWTYLGLFEKIGAFYCYAVNMLQYQVSFVLRNLTISTVTDLETLGVTNVIDKSKMNSFDEFLLSARKQIGHTFSFAGDFHDKLELAINDAQKTLTYARQKSQNARFQCYANLLTSIIFYASNAIKYQEAAMFNTKVQQISIAGHLSTDGLADLDTIESKITQFVEKGSKNELIPFVCKASSIINLYLFRIRFIVDSETMYTLQRKASNAVSSASEFVFGNTKSGSRLTKDIGFIKSNSDKIAKKFRPKRSELLSPDFSFKAPFELGECTSYQIKIPAAFDYTTIAQGSYLTTDDLSESTGALLNSLSKFTRRKMYFMDPIDIGRADAGPDDEGADAEILAEEEEAGEGGEEDFNEEEAAYGEEDWNEFEQFPDLTRAPDSQYDFQPLPPAPPSDYAAFTGVCGPPVFIIRGQPVQGVPSQPPPPPAIPQYAGIINPSNVDFSVGIRAPSAAQGFQATGYGYQGSSIISSLAPPPGVGPGFQRQSSESFFSSGSQNSSAGLQRQESDPYFAAAGAGGQLARVPSSGLFTIPEQPGVSALNLPPPPGVGAGVGGMPQLPQIPPQPLPQQEPSGGAPPMPPLPGMPPIPQQTNTSNGGMPPLPGMPQIPPQPQPQQGSNSGMPPLPGMPQVQLQNTSSSGLPQMPPLPGMPLPQQSAPSVSPLNLPPPPGVAAPTVTPTLPGIDGLNLPAGLPGLPAGPLKPEQRALDSIRERIADIEAVLANPLVTNEGLARVRGYAERMSSDFSTIEKTFM